MALVHSSGKDWFPLSAFTFDLVVTAEEHQNLSRNIKERCQSIHAVSPRHRLYGVILERRAFHLWQFDPQGETLHYSKPIRWKSEDAHNPASRWKDATRSMTIALLRIFVRDDALMQPPIIEMEMDMEMTGGEEAEHSSIGHGKKRLEEKFNLIMGRIRSNVGSSSPSVQ